MGSLTGSGTFQPVHIHEIGKALHEIPNWFSENGSVGLMRAEAGAEAKKINLVCPFRIFPFGFSTPS